ncbi:hypothetical protein GCM10027430_21190 [Lysobacter tyrosinilyticus]
MSYITAEELELLSFFEVEPERADPDRPWPFNDFSYRVTLDSYLVEFGIYPAHRDLSFSISHNGAMLYNFVALSVNDVRYHKDSDVETLEIVVSSRESVWLRLRPSLLVTQNVAAEA